LSRTRIILIATAVLFLAHVGVVVFLGVKDPGPLLSDAIQAVLGAMVIYAIVQAERRSEGVAISFWRLTAIAYAVLFMAQGLAVFNDFAHLNAIVWIDNLLFSFWFVPLGMAMLLDPESEAGKIDTLVALDFVQAVLVCVAAYVYFFYLPKAESTGGLSHEVWAPYFIGYSLVAGAFLLRALVTDSRDARALFGRVGIFLVLSIGVDALWDYGPVKGLRLGSWFDLLWSALLVIPLVIAATWTQSEAPALAVESPHREKRIYTEIFYLFYPLLVLFMSLRIAREKLGLAALIVLLAFVCSTARLLVTQNRLLNTREALRREASRDALTGLWNRKAIMDILQRELLRSERDRQPVGVIMIDVDHFKNINDSRGHAAGDAVLRIIASGIAAMVRPYDAVGRYGGEEFLIVAPNCDLSEAWELAERVRVHVAGCSIILSGSSVQVSLSLGVATGDAAANLEKVLHAADAALYEAKNAGRNRVAPALDRAKGAGRGTPTSPNRDFWL